MDSKTEKVEIYDNTSSSNPQPCDVTSGSFRKSKLGIFIASLIFLAPYAFAVILGIISFIKDNRLYHKLIDQGNQIVASIADISAKEKSLPERLKSPFPGWKYERTNEYSFDLSADIEDPTRVIDLKFNDKSPCIWQVKYLFQEHRIRTIGALPDELKQKIISNINARNEPSSKNESVGHSKKLIMDYVQFSIVIISIFIYGFIVFLTYLAQIKLHDRENGVFEYRPLSDKIIIGSFIFLIGPFSLLFGVVPILFDEVSWLFFLLWFPIVWILDTHKICRVIGYVLLTVSVPIFIFHLCGYRFYGKCDRIADTIQMKNPVNIVAFEYPNKLICTDGKIIELKDYMLSEKAKSLSSTQILEKIDFIHNDDGTICLDAAGDDSKNIWGKGRIGHQAALLNQMKFFPKVKPKYIRLSLEHCLKDNKYFDKVKDKESKNE